MKIHRMIKSNTASFVFQLLRHFWIEVRVSALDRLYLKKWPYFFFFPILVSLGIFQNNYTDKFLSSPSGCWFLLSVGGYPGLPEQPHDVPHSLFTWVFPRTRPPVSGSLHRTRPLRPVRGRDSQKASCARTIQCSMCETQLMKGRCIFGTAYCMLVPWPSHLPDSWK